MNTVTVTLGRTDFDRISNLLGIVALLATRDLDTAPEEDLRAILRQVGTPVPTEDARRLVDDLEHQALSAKEPSHAP